MISNKQKSGRIENLLMLHKEVCRHLGELANSQEEQICRPKQCYEVHIIRSSFPALAMAH